MSSKVSPGAGTACNICSVPWPQGVMTSVTFLNHSSRHEARAGACGKAHAARKQRRSALTVSAESRFASLFDGVATWRRVFGTRLIHIRSQCAVRQSVLADGFLISCGAHTAGQARS